MYRDCVIRFVICVIYSYAYSLRTYEELCINRNIYCQLIKKKQWEINLRRDDIHVCVLCFILQTKNLLCIFYKVAMFLSYH